MKKKVIVDSELRVTKEGIENSSAKLIPAKSVLIVARSGILQRTLPVCINKHECSVNQDIKVIIPYLRDMSFYLQLILKGFEKYILENLVKQGMTVQSLKYKEFEQALFPVPPLQEQIQILNKVNELTDWCDNLKEKLSQSQQTDQRLLEALVKQAAKEKEEPEELEEVTILPFPQRRKVDSEIKKISGISTIDTQAGSMCRIFVLFDNYDGSKEHFGRTKAEKTNHIIESHAKIDMGRMPKRMVRGAADFQRLVNKVEYKAEKKGWFTATEINGVIHYRKGTRFEQPYQKLDHKLEVKKAEVDRIIKLFIPLTTREAEVRQTVYAAWHDLIAYGQNPSHNQVFEWSSTEKYWTEEKEEIPKYEFYEAIEWLKENDLVPDGRVN